MREKCEVLALLAAPAWRRSGSTDTFWEESVKKMSRKCLTFQICCSQSIGNKFQKTVFKNTKTNTKNICSELCRKWLGVNGVTLRNTESGHFAVTVTSIRNGPIDSAVNGETSLNQNFVFAHFVSGKPLRPPVHESTRYSDLCFAICKFSQGVFFTSSNLAHIVFFSCLNSFCF